MSLSVLVSHTVRDNPEPKPSFHPTLAFDKLQQPVLREHLGSEDPRVVAAALISLQRIISSHLAARAAHESGVLASLGSIARVYDGGDHAVSLPIRRDALRCIALILASPAHRVESLSLPKVADALRATLADADEEIRLLAGTALATGAGSLDACRALTQLGFVATILAQLRVETSHSPAHPHAAHPHGHGASSSPPAALFAGGSAAAASAQLRALVSILAQPDSGAAVAACLAVDAQGTLAQALAASFAAAGGGAGSRAVAAVEATSLERHVLGLRAVMPLAFDAAGREACAGHPTLIRTLLALTAPPGHSDSSSSAKDPRRAEVARQALGCLMVRGGGRGVSLSDVPPLSLSLPPPLQALSTSDLAKRRIAEDAGGLATIVAALRAAPDAPSVVFAAKAIAGLCPFPPARAGLLAARAHAAATEAAARFAKDATVGRACAAAAAAVTWAA